MSGEQEALRDELAELVADVQAWAAWEAQRGAAVLPAEPPLPPAARIAPAPRPVQAPAGPPPVATRPPRPAPAAVAAPPRSPPPASPAPPAGPVDLGRWGRYTSPPVGRDPGAERDLLASARTLDEVRAVLGDCTRCALGGSRRNLVFGVGSASARLVVVGEGPGEQEDLRGEPFVGPAGAMLDRMLENVLHLRRADVYICNVVKCRPPQNRNPEPEEIALCQPFLMAQLAVLRPEVVLVLGSVALRTLFPSLTSITRARGRWLDLDHPGGRTRALPTFHPAYLLRKPEDKRKTMQDLLEVEQALAAARVRSP